MRKHKAKRKPNSLSDEDDSRARLCMIVLDYFSSCRLPARAQREEWRSAVCPWQDDAVNHLMRVCLLLHSEAEVVQKTVLGEASRLVVKKPSAV